MQTTVDRRALLPRRRPRNLKLEALLGGNRAPMPNPLESAMRNFTGLVCAFYLGAALCCLCNAQTYAIGADVSFLGKCEHDGVVFKEAGQAKDVLAILREHNYNWVRLRLFHDPSVSVDKLPNDLNYTLALAKRAKRMGFHLLLDLHYSDTWADPGKQYTPEAWSNLNHNQLEDQVFAYTRDVIAAFARRGLMP